MAATITGVILLVAIIYSGIGDFRAPVDDRLTGQVPPWYIDSLRSDRAGLLRGDAIRSLILVALALAALFYKIKNKISFSVLYGILGVLILFDLWGVDKRYLQSDDFVRSNKASETIPTAGDQRILNDPDINYRVLTYLQNPWAETSTSYFHKSIGGYHGAKMKRYQELIDGCLNSQYRDLLQSLQNQESEWSRFGVINMLNTRYFLLGSDENGVAENGSALGSAWLVSNATNVTSADDELAEVCSIDLSSTAIVDESRFQLSAMEFDNSGNILLEEYQPNYLKYNFENQANALAVFSEIYYPKGWSATIDGKPAKILRANFILRALEIPGGSHVIEFHFKPKAYVIGNKVMMASSILLILLFAGTFFLQVKNRNKIVDDSNY